MHPEQLDNFFPISCQQRYTSILHKRPGLTKRRAECFVRLWAYLLLKQQTHPSHSPKSLTQLYQPMEAIPCTLREAAAVFYSAQETGSDRAAGAMIEQLVELKLLDKDSDGQTLAFRIRSIPELTTFSPSPTPELYLDSFNCRTDAVSVANLMVQSHIELFKKTGGSAHKTARVLRQWAQQYDRGMRVLRRTDTHLAVGCYVLYPITQECEHNFCQSPSRSFYLSATDRSVDPFTLAKPGQDNCGAAFFRVWTFAASVFIDGSVFAQLLQDTQQTLRHMQQDYPGLCDLYGLIAHPRHREIQRSLNFEIVYQDSQDSFAWTYIPVDHFLKLTPEESLARFQAESNLESNLL